MVRPTANAIASLRPIEQPFPIPLSIRPRPVGGVIAFFNHLMKIFVQDSFVVKVADMRRRSIARIVPRWDTFWISNLWFVYRK